MKDKQYFLFSSYRGACELYDEGGVEQLISHCKDNPNNDFYIFETREFDPEVDSVTTLIDLAMNWSAYSEITQSDFDKLEEYQLNN